jgi:hypothetical protein
MSTKEGLQKFADTLRKMMDLKQKDFRLEAVPAGHDEVILLCPNCGNTNPVWVYSGPCNCTVYGIDNIPLLIAAELNHESKEGRIECIHCTCSLAVQVTYMSVVRILSECHREGWQVS